MWMMLLNCNIIYIWIWGILGSHSTMGCDALCIALHAHLGSGRLNLTHQLFASVQLLALFMTAALASQSGL